MVAELPELPFRPADGHKGTFGSVLVLAGSDGMSGAAVLAGRAALHGGAGLVTVGVPRCVAPIVAAAHPSYMTLGLPDADGHISADAIAAIRGAMAGKSCVAVGPGLGAAETAREVARRVWLECPMPVVLDADGLNAFAGCPQKLAERATDAARICTPHPGEFARLCGLTTAEIHCDRSSVAQRFASEHSVVLVLKGAGTVVTDGDRLIVNQTGNNGMATGGSGDVLTGLIAALVAQGMEGFAAAHLGVHLHGRAGDLAAAELSEPYLTSSDLVDYLAPAWKSVL